jgi:hypothetical protein
VVSLSCREYRIEKAAIPVRGIEDNWLATLVVARTDTGALQADDGRFKELLNPFAIDVRSIKGIRCLNQVEAKPVPFQVYNSSELSLRHGEREGSNQIMVTTSRDSGRGVHRQIEKNA